MSEPSSLIGVALASLVAEIEAQPELVSRLRRALGIEHRPGETDLLTLREAGLPLRVTRAAIAQGELPAVRVGREYRVRRTDFDVWLERRRVLPRAPVVREKSEVERAIERAERAGTLVPIRRVRP